MKKSNPLSATRSATLIKMTHFEQKEGYLGPFCIKNPANEAISDKVRIYGNSIN